MKRIIAALATLVIILSLVSCASPEKKLLGEWIHTQKTFGISIETGYRFEEDGKGAYITAAGIELDIEYTVEGDTLTIKFVAPDAAEKVADGLGVDLEGDFTYDFDSDKLILTVGDDARIYEKRK